MKKGGSFQLRGIYYIFNREMGGRSLTPQTTHQCVRHCKDENLIHFTELLTVNTVSTFPVSLVQLG